MTKFETKQVETIKIHVALGNIESAALGLSSLIRCARTTKSAVELTAIAEVLVYAIILNSVSNQNGRRKPANKSGVNKCKNLI